MSRLSPGALALLLVTIIACEDVPPNAYTAEYVVEGYLVVDEPIRDIRVIQSQSVSDSFRSSNGLVTDAEVLVIDGSTTHHLGFRPASASLTAGYYLPDTTVTVQPNRLYRLEVRTKDGKLMTAQTTTPGRISWVVPPKDTVSVPPKSDPAFLEPPDSLGLSWTDVAGTPEYLISVRALDTLEYGVYLPSPTDRKNRRVDPDLDKQVPRFNDISRWGFLAGLSTPIVWNAFKWYGPQEVAVWAADDNMIRWFKMTYWQANPTYNPLLGNVKGDGLGVFASASVTRKKLFLVMADG